MTSPPPAAPTNTRQQLALVWGAVGTMFDVAMVVLGTALIGLAAAVLLDGFELVSIGLDLSTGAMLGSSLVIGVVGGFALGIASEGPLGRGKRSVGEHENQLLVARFAAAIVIGLVLLLIHGILDGYTEDLPRPFQIGVASIRAVAIGGLTAVPLVGVPLAWWARSGGLGQGLMRDGDIPIIFLIWAVTTMVAL